jgi:hypothetical protein
MAYGLGSGSRVRLHEVDKDVALDILFITSVYFEGALHIPISGSDTANIEIFNLLSSRNNCLFNHCYTSRLRISFY